VRPKTIISRDNQLFKLARSLGTRKGREKKGMFLVEGSKLVNEVLSQPELVEAVLISEVFHESCLENVLAAKIPVVSISNELAKALAETETSQGIWAICRQPDWDKAEYAEPLDLVLILAAIQDPGNLGTILRTAWAVGVQLVYLSPGSVDPFNPKVIRSAAGAHLNLPVITGAGLDKILALKKAGFSVWACDPQGETDLYRSDLKGRLALIMGNEGQGLSPEWRAVADGLLKIPLQPQVDSLNVAVACAVVLYEVYRQRQHG